MICSALHRWSKNHQRKANSMIGFYKKYFLLTILLFAVEILIAVYVHDRIVRPYIGDVLVVILIYCAVRSFFRLPVFATALGVLLFAYLVEYLQYYHLVQRLGWEKIMLARVVMGTSFSWTDILAYTIGVGFILAAENFYCAGKLLKGRK